MAFPQENRRCERDPQCWFFVGVWIQMENKVILEEVIMQKWEYCLISGITAGSTGEGYRTSYPKMYVFTNKGAILKTNFKQRPSGISEEDMVAMTIASLGAEGWELVDVSFNAVLWFKRPIPS